MNSNRPFPVLWTLTCLLLLAAPALATHWVAFSATADCQGWQVDGEIKIAASHPYLDVPYTVVLTGDGSEIERQTGDTGPDLISDLPEETFHWGDLKGAYR